MKIKPRIRLKAVVGKPSLQTVEDAWSELFSKAYQDIVKAKFQYQMLALAKQYGDLPCAG